MKLSKGFIQIMTVYIHAFVRVVFITTAGRILYRNESKVEPLERDAI